MSLVGSISSFWQALSMQAISSLSSFSTYGCKYGSKFSDMQPPMSKYIITLKLWNIFDNKFLGCFTHWNWRFCVRRCFVECFSKLQPYFIAFGQFFGDTLLEFQGLLKSFHEDSNVFFLLLTLQDVSDLTTSYCCKLLMQSNMNTPILWEYRGKLLIEILQCSIKPSITPLCIFKITILTLLEKFLIWIDHEFTDSFDQLTLELQSHSFYRSTRLLHILS